MRLLAILFLAVGTASSCMADRITGYVGKVTFSRSGAYGSNSGGEFTLSGSIWDSSGAKVDGLDFDNVRSFCVELNENLRLGTEYHFAITDYAVMGGNGGKETLPGGGTRDKLGNDAKVIYNNWLDRRDSYPYENSAARNDANLVQKAVWQSEGEKNYNSASLNSWIANQLSNPGTMRKTRVLNLFSSATDFGQLHQFQQNNDGDLNLIGTSSEDNTLLGNKVLKQDQIVAVVPEPTSVVLFGFGALAFGVARRRRR